MSTAQVLLDTVLPDPRAQLALCQPAYSVSRQGGWREIGSSPIPLACYALHTVLTPSVEKPLSLPMSSTHCALPTTKPTLTAPVGEHRRTSAPVIVASLVDAPR